MQLIEHEIIENEVSQELDDCWASGADLSTPETENVLGETEISQNREPLAVQLRENIPL